VDHEPTFVQPLASSSRDGSRRAAVHDYYAHQILSAIEAGTATSQRSLAGRLGIALGLTNLLIRRLARKGWIRVTRVQPNRVAYFLTPRGLAEKARMSSAYFQHSIQYYASARDRITASFAALSAQWPTDGVSRKPVVFLGTGEAAEIGYLCMQETDLTLVAVVDFQGRQRFFGVPVYSAERLSADWLPAVSPDPVVIVCFSDAEQNRACLERIGVPGARVCWV
jgi:DNA-binding MarR family transcriptional regulator